MHKFFGEKQLKIQLAAVEQPDYHRMGNRKDGEEKKIFSVILIGKCQH